MQEGAKRRLVGAAVIVLLLVVFLPMLLEDDAQEPVSQAEMAVPARPAVERDQPKAVLPAPEVARLPKELAPPALYDEEEQADTEPAEPKVAAPKPEKAAPAASKPVPAPAAEKKEPAKPAPSPVTSENLTSWVVQIASVTEQASAQALAEQLRGKGFPAFVEQAQVKGKTYHRVRVGPDVDRKRLDAMAASIAQKTGHKGQVQRYP